MRQHLFLLAALALVSGLVACSENTPALSVSADVTVDGQPADEEVANKGAGAKGAKASKSGTKRTAKASPKSSARTKASSKASARGNARAVGDAPPMPGAPGRLEMNMNIQDGDETHEASVSAGFDGANINLKSKTTVRQGVAFGEPPPAPTPTTRRARTCKAALLAKGHPSSSLIHCDGVNNRCAVALLNAGNNPSSLVHCSDVEDVDCAVQLLKQGRNPTSIVHCD